MTPFTFPAQYAMFCRIKEEQKRKTVSDDYFAAREVGVYRDNMGILYSKLSSVTSEEFANRFTDNIEDVYNEGVKQTKINIALKMKSDGVSIDTIAKYTQLSIDEISSL